MVCRFEGRRREIRFVLHLLDLFFFFIHGFISPKLCNTPSDKNAAKATRGVDCMSTAGGWVLGGLFGG